MDLMSRRSMGEPTGCQVSSNAYESYQMTCTTGGCVGIGVLSDLPMRLLR